MKRSSLFTLFLVVFIDLLSFGIVIPILPYYAQTFGANGWEIGWLMTSYSLMQFLMAPLWGRISDWVGRRPVFLMSIFGATFAMLLLAHAPSLLWVFIARILAGISGANISTAYAYISDVTPPEKRVQGMGIIGASFGLGFVLGPAFGGILSQYGYQVPFLFGAALAGTNWILAFFTLKEPELTPEQREAHRSKKFELQTIREVLSLARCRQAIFSFFLLTLAVTQLEVVFAIFMKGQYGLSAYQAGLLLGMTGLIMAGMQGGIVGKLNKRFPEAQLITVGFFEAALALALVGMTDSLELTIAALCFLAIGHGLLHPSLSTLASKSSPSQTRGSVMGIFHSASSLARVVGPPFAGWVYDHLSPHSPFLFGAGFLMIGLLVFILLKESQTSETQLKSKTLA